MRSLQLQTALGEFVQAAGAYLQQQIEAGAEVPFEVEQQNRRRRGGGATLYCYQPLTDQFIAEREAALERLPSYAPAATLLAGFEGLERYLASIGVDVAPGARRAGVRSAMRALLGEVFAGQSDFELREERVQAALERLENSTLTSANELTFVATLHGLAISSPELALTSGLTIVRPDALDGLPPGAAAVDERDPNGHLVVVLRADEQEPREALERGREVLCELLRALRLFGDGRVTLGALGWARMGGGSWNALALGAEARPRGLLLVASEQEDELRAFCNLVSRRAPHGNELAWALRRFELGCERANPHEALTDHLLALRALLEPEGPGSGLLALRVAALCATQEHRGELTERIEQAIALERAEIAGTAVRHAASDTLAKDVADHLRALLRDVICGHLDGDLVTLADVLLSEDAEPELGPEPAFVAAAEPAGLFGALSAARSREQMLGDASEAEQILDVFI